jgi:hypothetical protein
MKKTVIALLTCNRKERTAETIRTLFAHNEASHYQLFHADDASTDGSTEFVKGCGFETLVANPVQLGCSPTTAAFMRAIAERVEPGTPVIYLQNDFVSVRQIPPLAAELLQDPTIGFVQLAYRKPRSNFMRSLRFCHPGTGAAWDYGDKAHGDYVLTAPGGGGTTYHAAIAKIEAWVAGTAGATRERDFINSTRATGKRTARLTTRVFQHVGKTTPGGMFGKRGSRKAKGDQPAVDNRDLVCEVTGFERAAMHAGVSLCHYLARTIHPGMRTLELGSGLTTWLFEAVGTAHTALEDSATYAPPLRSVKICPLVNAQGKPTKAKNGGWYDWKPASTYDLIFIDGPRGYRAGVLPVIDSMVHATTTIVLDDTHRRRDSDLAGHLAARFGFVREDHRAFWGSDYKKSFTVLQPGGVV